MDPRMYEKFKQSWLSNLKGDTLAGIVVALALIPEAIAFSIIAGVDPKVGLYASFAINPILGLLIVWSTLGTFNFEEIFRRLRSPEHGPAGTVELAHQFVRASADPAGKGLRMIGASRVMKATANIRSVSLRSSPSMA